MGRTVKVGLDLESAPYIAGAQGATKATEDLGDSLAETAAKGERLGGVADDADRAGDAIDDMGDSARRAATHVDKLDDEIAKARQSLVLFSAQFAEADEASRADLTTGVKALENKLKDLEKHRTILKALVPKAGEAAQAGADTGREVATGVAKGIASTPALGPIAIGAAIAAGVAVAPVLGTAIAGAVVGGVGLGGIVGGVALAASHPEIKKRGTQLGKTYFEGIKDEAEQAFAQPIMDALDEVEDWGRTALPRIGEFFDNVAPGLGAFTDSVIGAGDALLDSFVYASERSEEPMRALGDLIETTGEAVGSLIEYLADHAESGADALDDLATAISFTVGALAGMITMMADTYEWLGDQTDILEVGTDTLTGYGDGLIGVTAAQGLAEVATVDLNSATEDLSENQWAGARAARGHRDALVELSAEMKAETDPVFGLLEAQEDLAEATKNAAEATEEHGRNSVEAKEATRDLAEAAINLQGKAGELGDTFNGRVSAGLRATLRSAGLTEGQIDDLERQFREAKGAAEGFARNWEANVTVPGLFKATRDVKDLRTEINKLRGKTIPINVRISQHGEILYGGQASAWMAEGGPVLGPGPKGVDSEVRVLAPGEHVLTAAEVDAMGGHRAVEQMRAEVLSGGSAAPATSRVMPASAVQRVVVDVRGGIDLQRADATAFGQLLASTLRTESAIRTEVKHLLAKT